MEGSFQSSTFHSTRPLVMVRKRCSRASPCPAPRASGFTNRSSNQMPRWPKNVENVGYHRAKPAVVAFWSSMANSTWAAGTGPNSAASMSARCHTTSWASCS